jgi:hypothetical protein
MFKPLFIGLAGFLICSCGLSAQNLGFSRGQEFPVAAKARYKGKLYPVIAVDNLAPKVMVDGKRFAADASPRVRIIPSPAFGPGTVVIEESKLTFWTETQESTDGLWRSGKIPLSLSFTGKLTSDTELKDCFIVLVFYQPSTLHASSLIAPYYVSGVYELGALKIGKPKTVRVDYDVSLLEHFPEKDFAWFVIVQSGVVQIRSTGGPNAADSLISAQLAWVKKNK